MGARYSIKECIFDFFRERAGFTEKNYGEIEITNNELGKPIVGLSGGTSDCAGKLGITDIIISISHSRNLISGMVLFCS
jgi:phosphopantetheinyl transferase (holo-ACP synthase)